MRIYKVRREYNQVSRLKLYNLITPHHKRTFAFLGLFLVMKIGNQPSVVWSNVRLSNSIAQAAEELVASYPNTEPEDYSALHASFQVIDPYLETLYENLASLFADLPEDEADPLLFESMP